jgi:glycosyltransferase involved in cell wall biosynthesis
LPKFSVIIPTFNRADFLKNCIESVLNQTETDFELIIVDDNSSDSSQEIIGIFDDNRINTLYLKEHVGAMKARNLGILRSQGAYIAWLDSDDLMYPSRLAIQGKFLEQNKDFILVGGVLDGHPISSEFTPVPVGCDVRAYLTCGNFYDHSSIMVRMSALPRRANLYKEVNFDDYFMYSDLITAGKFAFLSEPVGKYTYHANQVSKTNVEFKLEPGSRGTKEIKRIKRRILRNCLLAGITPRQIKICGLKIMDIFLLFIPEFILITVLRLRR